jgi:three-Cys-motif partner protein
MDSMTDELKPDGLVVRSAGPWAREKLLICARYFSAYGVACKRWKEWFYVDGLAGSGVNQIGEFGPLEAGSALLALDAQPTFSRCLLLEQDERNVDALLARTHEYGRRAIVHQGDVNVDLLPLMRQHIPSRHPTLVFLDPDGLEVNWSTVAQIAAFRLYKWKTEILILFPEGVYRVAGVSPEAAGGWAPARLDAFWGGDARWHDIDERVRRRELVTPGQRRIAAIELYERKLYELDYKTVFTRGIHEHGTEGRVKYTLMFATDNDTGATIMNDCFNPHQLSFDGIMPPLR